MIELFRKTKFRPDSIAKINKMVEIVEEYQEQGLRLTARQLYYQFVSRDFIPNTPAEYKKLTSLLADARYAGLIDWDAIEDRGRQPETPADWDNIGELVESALRSYRLPRWRGQGKHVELWVEKQALAGVLWPLASRYHTTLMVNKGYSSASAMYESARRIKQAGEPENIIFYLGDHDPSGEDMVRDIEDRLVEFEVEDLTVTKIALNMAQIKQYNPPPNPAKMTDSRAVAYVAKFGDQSWEVDALPPNVLVQLIRDAFDQEIDTETMDAIKAREQHDKEALRKAATKLVKKG
jgi:hypothetical protein